MGEMAMLTVTGWATTPSLEEVAERLSLPLGACDPSFGVILVDPNRLIYAIRVDISQVPEGLTEKSGVSGPFSDPKIAPFGKPEPDP